MVQWTISSDERRELGRAAGATSPPGLAARRGAPLRRSSLSQVHWTCSRATRAAPHPELRRMGVI